MLNCNFVQEVVFKIFRPNFFKDKLLFKQNEKIKGAGVKN